MGWELTAVAAITPALLLVLGYSGIGKSTVIHELHRPIVARRGFFVSGKFEPRLSTRGFLHYPVRVG